MTNAAAFLRLAERFDNAGDEGGRDARIHRAALADELGTRIIEAVDAGRLSDPHIAAIVAWSRNRGEHPGITGYCPETGEARKGKPRDRQSESERGAFLVRCPMNVASGAIDRLAPFHPMRIQGYIAAPKADAGEMKAMLAKDSRERTAGTCRTLAAMLADEPRDAPAGVEVKPTHSIDFTTVVWDGREFHFAKGQQAEAVRILWEEWHKGGGKHRMTVSEKTIADKIGSSADNFRLAHVFREHPAWDTMIVKGESKGTFAIAPSGITD